MQLTGAEIIWESLLREGVDVLFGYPGGAILPTYDALSKYPQIHHVLVRHEQNAAHMADGYARASGKVGVCMVTSGPGATNLTTGLATAMMDSSGIVAITGQVPTKAIGSDAFQETDVTGVTLPVTKHNYLVSRVEDLAQTIHEAFHIARTGRPGPVLIDVPRDLQNARTEFVYPTTPVRLPGYRPKPSGSPEQIRRAAALINAAKQPVVLAGHGITISGAQDELLEFVEKTGIPVSTTLLGISSIAESHPLCLGMMGMHGEAYTNLAIQDSDLVFAIGMRFDDRVTGNLAKYLPHADVIHVDIDAAEIGKNVPTDIGIVGDAKAVLQQILPLVEPGERSDWLNKINEWRNEVRARDIIHQEFPDDILLAPHVMHELWRVTGGAVLVTTDVGQHQMWEAQYFRHDRRNQLITSGGLGTMGFALPACMGAKFAQPNEEIWCVVGDGGIQMSIPELATLVQENLDVKIAIINNGFLGMVRQWQELMYDRRYIATPLLQPDFVKLAEAYGIMGMRVTRQTELAPAITRARAHRGPVLIDFRVEEDTNVFPMVGPGRALHDMIRRPLHLVATEAAQ
ncbi:MAG: biosynthetic-type acetolactate synthase large subunit [Anaerolineae bacterium]|nr:biosynthetic-type acetolactate synthase large subunit [Anaerolineae bacterium]